MEGRTGTRTSAELEDLKNYYLSKLAYAFAELPGPFFSIAGLFITEAMLQ